MANVKSHSLFLDSVQYKGMDNPRPTLHSLLSITLSPNSLRAKKSKLSLYPISY